MLRELLEYYESMKVISWQQKDAIERDDYEALSDLITRKQEIINKIDEINEGDPSILRNAADKIMAIVDSQYELEKENEEMLDKKINDLKAKLVNIDKGLTAAQAYAEHTVSKSPKFLDVSQ